jgi:hypothetical protein
MPGLDRTGPNGEGPRTGRGLGKCNPGSNESADSEDNSIRGFGGGRFRRGPGGAGRDWGRGGGWGRGRGRNS